MEDASAGIAGAAAQESYGNLRYMAKRLDKEMQRLIRDNPEVAKAAAKYQAKERAYEEAVWQPQSVAGPAASRWGVCGGQE
jgi:hypothetical protein